MGVKVQPYKETWYVFLDYLGQRKAKKMGSRKRAESVRRIVEAKLALGDLSAVRRRKAGANFH